MPKIIFKKLTPQGAKELIKEQIAAAFAKNQAATFPVDSLAGIYWTRDSSPSAVEVIENLFHEHKRELGIGGYTYDAVERRVTYIKAEEASGYLTGKRKRATGKRKRAGRKTRTHN